MLTHLQDRGLNPDLYPTTLVTSATSATFYLTNLQGHLTGYQQYNPNGDKKERKNPVNGKYFTHTTKGEDAVWGLEYQSDESTLFVCEGIFKACKFHSLGYRAIATLGNNPKHLSKLLQELQKDYTVVMVPDPDEAGLKYFPKYGDDYVITAKPVDDMSIEELEQYLLF